MRHSPALSLCRANRLSCLLATNVFSTVIKTSRFSPGPFSLLFSISTSAVRCRAETGCVGWLRYQKIDGAYIEGNYDESLPAAVVTSSGSEFTQSAQSDLVCAGRNAGRTFGNHASIALTHSCQVAFKILQTNERTPSPALRAPCPRRQRGSGPGREGALPEGLMSAKVFIAV